MNSKAFLLIFFILTVLNISTGQNKKPEMITVIGYVTNINNEPIKGALIFIDSVKTNSKTNKKGYYKVRIPLTTKEIAAYSPDHGILSDKYSGEKKVSFVFKEGKPLSEEHLVLKMGYVVKRQKQDDSMWYANYSSILQILENRFPSVRVYNGKIIIGKGPNSFGGDSDPLIFVDGQRSNISVLTTIPTIEVKKIRVVTRGSEAAEYGGLQGANGVILITLK